MTRLQIHRTHILNLWQWNYSGLGAIVPLNYVSKMVYHPSIAQIPQYRFNVACVENNIAAIYESYIKVKCNGIRTWLHLTSTWIILIQMYQDWNHRLIFDSQNLQIMIALYNVDVLLDSCEFYSANDLFSLTLYSFTNCHNSLVERQMGLTASPLHTPLDLFASRLTSSF